MQKFFRDKEHLVRVAALFAAGFVLFVLARALFVPKGFGLYGHYRAGALADNRARTGASRGEASAATATRTRGTSWLEASTRGSAARPATGRSPGTPRIRRP